MTSEEKKFRRKTFVAVNDVNIQRPPHCKCSPEKNTYGILDIARGCSGAVGPKAAMSS